MKPAVCNAGKAGWAGCGNYGFFSATLLALFLAAGLSPREGGAQTAPTIPSGHLSGPHADALRRGQLAGRDSTSAFLIRRSSWLIRSVGGTRGSPAWSLNPLTPTLHLTHNSDLVFSFNDGALWAGRGWNARVSAGFLFRSGPLTVVFAPQHTYAQNRPYQAIPYPVTDSTRSRWAHPYHPLPESLDWPIRMGDEPIHSTDLGQSSATLDTGPMRVGVSTENLWWGPGIRNGIVFSSQGPGFPHGFVSTRAPIPTRLGDIEATWLVGRLEESDFFDVDLLNDHRSLSAVGLTLRTAFDPGLTLGLARVVYAALPRGDRTIGAAFDVFGGVGQPNSTPPDEPVPPGPDQITSAFFRWVFAPAGFEVYAEWARFEEPESFMDFLEFPQHQQGYTAGLQWLDERSSGTWLGVQLEHTNLEPSSTFRHRRVYTNYSSRSVVQGYTHRGQVIGAAIGPAASGQWLAIDHGWPGGSTLGLVAGRVRWDNAVWLTSIVPDPRRPDVTLFSGLRGSAAVGGWTIHAELNRSVRLNYLFQTFPPDERGIAEGVDVPNTSFGLTLARRTPGD